MQLNCDYCLICIECKPSRVKRNHNNFCSKHCHNLWMSKNLSGKNSIHYKDGLRGMLDTLCYHCGKTHLRKPSTIKRHMFCSKKCYGEWCSINIIGESHNQWKGGGTPAYRLARTKKSYVTWRTKVFKRDNYTCQLCGEYGGTLNAHHIKEFASDLDNREVLENGVTLCITCHKDLHNG